MEDVSKGASSSSTARGPRRERTIVNRRWSSLSGFRRPSRSSVVVRSSLVDVGRRTSSVIVANRPAGRPVSLSHRRPTTNDRQPRPIVLGVNDDRRRPTVGGGRRQKTSTDDATTTTTIGDRCQRTTADRSRRTSRSRSQGQGRILSRNTAALSCCATVACGQDGLSNCSPPVAAQRMAWTVMERSHGWLVGRAVGRHAVGQDRQYVPWWEGRALGGCQLPERQGVGRRGQVPVRFWERHGRSVGRAVGRPLVAQEGPPSGSIAESWSGDRCRGAWGRGCKSDDIAPRSGRQCGACAHARYFSSPVTQSLQARKRCERRWLHAYNVPSHSCPIIIGVPMRWERRTFTPLLGGLSALPTNFPP